MQNTSYTLQLATALNIVFYLQFPTKMIRKCGTGANLVLQWIGDCLTTNSQVTGS